MPDAKYCSGCEQTLPAPAFYTRADGRLSSRCKKCKSAANAGRQRARTAARNADPEVLRARQQHAERVKREREARELARAVAREAARAEAQARATSRVKTGAKLKGNRRKAVQPVSPEELAANRERVDYLLLLLSDRHPTEQIATEQSWNAAYSEVDRLWYVSGDRECVACHRRVSPHQMLPPMPGNGRPGMCRPCAAYAEEENHRRTFGPLIGPLQSRRKLRMLDGSWITLGELARRHRARTRGQPHQSPALAA